MSDVPLPPEILAGILSRLPVDSLLRFRCVSKPWRALIDSQYFINLHLNQSIKTNTNLYQMVGDYAILSCNPVGSPPHMRKTIHHPFLGKRSVVVIGSCNGVICLCTKESDYETVFLNPLTRRFKKVPLRPLRSSIGSVNEFFMVEGFGYDHVNDDYKLVRLSQSWNLDSGLLDSKIEVYGSKLGLWREAGNLPYYIGHQTTNFSVFASGALHWLVGEKPEPEFDEHIAAFDLTTEELRLFPRPKISDRDFKANLGVLGGRLCMVCNYRGKRVDVWMMKSHGVKKSWTKMTSIVDVEVTSRMVFLRPLLYSKRGVDVLFQQNLNIQFWYDLEKEKVIGSTMVCMPNMITSGVFTGSLVQVDTGGASGSGARKDQMKEKKKNAKRRDDFLSKGFKLAL